MSDRRLPACGLGGVAHPGGAGARLSLLIAGNFGGRVSGRAGGVTSRQGSSACAVPLHAPSLIDPCSADDLIMITRLLSEQKTKTRRRRQAFSRMHVYADARTADVRTTWEQRVGGNRESKLVSLYSASSFGCQRDTNRICC